AAPADVAVPVVIAEKPPQSGRPTIPPVPPRLPTERPLTPPSRRSAPALVDTTQKTAAPVFDASSEGPEDLQLPPELELAFELEDEEAVPMPRRAPRDTETQHLTE